MSVAAFYEHLGLPEASLLEKRIVKRMLQKHGRLTGSDKRMLSTDVSALVWKYTLKDSTLPVLPFQDAEREYLEIAIVEVMLTSRLRARRIAEMVQRAIPYPVLLILVDTQGFSVSVAHKRFSLAEKGGSVVEHFLRTPWLDSPHVDADQAFLTAMALSNLSQRDFYALYSGMVRAVLARCCAEQTGTFRLDVGMPEPERLKLLEEAHGLEREIASLRLALKEEQRFARKVGLNSQIKELEAQLAHIKGRL